MHESIQAGLELRARRGAVGNGGNWYCRFKCQPGSQPLQSVGTSRNITSVTEVSRRGGFLRNVGTEFKLMQELLRHSSLRSTLDIYTQAITPAKHAAQRAVLSLVFSPEENLSSSLEAPAPAEA
jgi:hypothetical protein